MLYELRIILGIILIISGAAMCFPNDQIRELQIADEIDAEWQAYMTANLNANSLKL